ncbi:MAG: hypothetical protein OXE40_01320 [Gammaproteobacteria bacterium]|nr:hypothetical protein [Gammaproteobacteria bacterium]
MQAKVSAHALCLAAAAAAGMATAGFAAAQDIPLNYERLSSMEEPLAREAGGVTFVLTGLVDAPATLDREDDDSLDAGIVANFQLSALDQLPNRWRVGLAYFGQYVTDEALGSDPGDRYTDNAALSVGGYLGTVLGGNVSGIVREGTRRRRGAGNASLAFDNALGELANVGAGYTVRLGPWIVGAVVDEDADFDIGATFQRPIDDTDYRLTGRVTQSVYAGADGARQFDSLAIAGVGEVIYGSTAFDVGVGYEEFSSSGPDASRWYVSAGGRRKTGVVSLSLEGHLGRIEGEDERSGALGAQYDLARGMSVNLGVNYAKALVDLGGASFVNAEDTKAVVSLRYSF